MSETELEENWKDKYFKAIMDQDDLEKASNERTELIFKELLHSFGHFQGRDENIDKTVEELSRKPDINDIDITELQSLNHKIASILDSISDINTDQSTETTPSSGENDPYTIAKDSLEYLIEQLPKEVRKKIDSDKLSKALKNANSVDSLKNIADEIKNVLSLLLNERNKKIKELSGFLGTVARKLDGLQSHLKDEKSGRQSSSSDRGDLTEIVGNNLKELRESVADAESLDALQQEIETRIDKIDHKVATFVEAETTRANTAEKSSEALSAQLKKLENQASQLRQSLEAARTEAIIDPLTGVSNRRAYEERFEIEYARWKRNHEPLTLAIMDIDKFKNINDTYGHPIGDKVLKVVSGRIQQQVRESDFFGRIGGEEFAFILVNSSLEDALDKVETLRKSVAECNFRIKKKKFQVTISIGLATFKGNDSIETIYSRADEALVQAKQTGRNKTLSEVDLKNNNS